MSTPRGEHLQLSAGVRFDWGLQGALSHAVPNGCTVVVDVLSFTTAVSVLTARGTSVYPYRWRDASASSFADSVSAALAVGRSQVSAHEPWSLSPAALTTAPFVDRLVLPSPNGSTISVAAGGVVVAACLRNARAVARWLTANGFGTVDRPVAVVAAGELWHGDVLRPCVEDLLGAGHLISALADAGLECSVEASMAAASFAAVGDIEGTLLGCASGLELCADGFEDDVRASSAVDADGCVPVMKGGVFVDAFLRRTM